MDDRNTIWDVIVIGAGMAGSACASRLSARNLRCLVIESGLEHPAPPARRNLRAKIAGRLGLGTVPPRPSRWPGKIALARGTGAQLIPAVLGTGPGGGSLVYGAALTRFRPDDFDVKPHVDEAQDDDSLPDDWPFPVEVLEPWYAVAEAAMGVRGERDPGDPRSAAVRALPAAPPGGPRAAALETALRDRGLQPFRLPVGIDYRAGCSECLGIPCPRRCKADAWSRLAACAGSRLRLVTGESCLRIDRLDGGLFAVSTVSDAGPVRHLGHRVVLAAGALNTPAILQRSRDLWAGAVPDMVGRGLMFHHSDLFMVRPPGDAPPGGMLKTLGLRDFYRFEGLPLGEVQSLGVVADTAIVVGHLRSEVQRIGLGWLAPIIEFARLPVGLLRGVLARRIVLATILEDRPYRSNRVIGGETPHAPLRVEYTETKELRVRAKTMRTQLRTRFRGLGPVFLSRRGALNYGHPMGTCRMGADQASSVVDPSGRVHGQPGLYVCDASTFPSSGGTNPGLTVLANALRIGEAIADDAVSDAGPAAA